MPPHYYCHREHYIADLIFIVPKVLSQTAFGCARQSIYESVSTIQRLGQLAIAMRDDNACALSVALQMAILCVA